MESALLVTADGVELEADVQEPPDGRAVVGAVAICHPHPQYGGDRFNPVVEAMFGHLPTIGFTALRFDFRREFGGGVDERLDLQVAVETLVERNANGARSDLPVHVVGYSFGAAVALAVHDPRIARIVAVAPPLGLMQVTTPSVPTLVVTPQHDQFAPPSVAEPIVDGWPDATFEVVASTDHFLVGRSRDVAERAGVWLSDSTVGHAGEPPAERH